MNNLKKWRRNLIGLACHFQNLFTHATFLIKILSLAQHDKIAVLFLEFLKKKQETGLLNK